MGFAKEQQLREWEQGWSFVDGDRAVCARCFEDEAVKGFIRESASEKECSYCGRRAKKPIAAPMNDVLGLIGDGIRYEYQDADNANLPVEGGEYVFGTMTSRDVLDDIGDVTENDDVREEIVRAFGDTAWVTKPFYGLPENEELRHGWQAFVKVVKYQRRYMFLKPKRRKRRHALDSISPDVMLDRIARVINDVGLVREMKAGTPWFRARAHGPAETYTKAIELGTVPRKYARASNRMSPAGIPMFYGADDDTTAVAETYTPKPGVPAAVTVGRFETARDMWVVDLTDLPPFPSLFDEQRRYQRAALAFLRGFVEDLAKPIKKDGREHINYVPTQVGTEYLRYAFRAYDVYRVKGVIYPSARNSKGKCCALFVRNKGCCDVAPGGQMDKKGRLGLVATTRHEYK